jgi:putative zinc finger/helix-turn-helix YgiT family protein
MLLRISTQKQGAIMKCLNCNGDKFEEKNYRFSPEIKGEEVEVIVSAMVCTQCHDPLMNDEQMSQLRKATADAYRKKHGLLTSEEIVNFRNSFGMSQASFANYLKVGEASIKRWETYFVQDVGQDEHIRLKCDEAYAEFSALNVHWKSHPPDVYSGNRRFSWELFKQAVRYLVVLNK